MLRIVSIEIIFINSMTVDSNFEESLTNLKTIVRNLLFYLLRKILCLFCWNKFRGPSQEKPNTLGNYTSF
mgnify:CR=1 FL=1